MVVNGQIRADSRRSVIPLDRFDGALTSPDGQSEIAKITGATDESDWQLVIQWSSGGVVYAEASMCWTDVMTGTISGGNGVPPSSGARPSSVRTRLR